MKTIARYRLWVVALSLSLLGLIQGCKSQQPIEDGTHQFHLHQRNQIMSYLLHVPPVPSDQPMPLVILLHDRDSSAEEILKLSKLRDFADEHGFAVAAPDAPGGNFSAGVTQVRGYTPRHWQLIESLIDVIGGQITVDESAVFLVGMGNGGSMAQTVAAILGERIAAIASIGGKMLVRPRSEIDPLSVLLIFGAQDPLNTAMGTAEDKRRAFAPRSEAKLWSSLLGCSTSISATFETIIRHRGWHGCRGGSQVNLLEIEGLGHHWPGGAVSQAERIEQGPYLAHVKATAIIWDFFSRVAERHTSQ